VFLGMTTDAQSDKVFHAVIPQDAALLFVVDLDEILRSASYAAKLVALEDLAPAKFVAVARENFTAIRQRAGAAARMGSNAGFTTKGLSLKQESD
jgi:hypothetical protein